MNNNDFDKRMGLTEEFENYNFKENHQMYNSDQLTEIRKQIFPRYIGQRIIKSTEYTGILFVSGNYLDDNRFMSTFCFQLIPLTSITDEDSIEIYRMLGYNDEKYGSGHPKMMFEFYGKIKLDEPNKWGFNTSVKIYQYLQLKGYALPQLILLDGKPVTLSVEQQINLGIIEIIK